MSDDTNAPFTLESNGDLTLENATVAEIEVPTFDASSAIDALPETPAVFDPTAAMDSADTSFDDILGGTVEGADAEQVAAQIREEMRTSNFGQIDVNDFSAFNASDVEVADGEFQFTIEQKNLREVVGTTRLTVASSNAQYGACKVTIFRDKLKIQTFNQTAFSEEFVPLSKPSNVEDGKEPAFIFDHSVLAKIASTFTEPTITMTYAPRDLLLKIESYNDKGVRTTELQLATFPRANFTEYHGKIGEPRHLGKVNPQMLRKAVSYGQLFVRKDDVQQFFSQIEFRDNTALGGTQAAVGIFEAEFSSLAFKAKYEVIGVLEKMLARFNAENTHLFETDTYYILRDESLYFGFEKFNFQFPDVAKMASARASDFVLLPRPQLLNALYKLSVVSVDRDLLIRVQIEGAGKDAQLILITKDASGKESRDILNCARYPSDGINSEFQPQDFSVSISAFTKIVAHFDSANVHLEALPKALLVLDTTEGEFTAKTVMTSLTPADVERLRAARESNKGAKPDA